MLLTILVFITCLTQRISFQVVLVHVKRLHLFLLQEISAENLRSQRVYYHFQPCNVYLTTVIVQPPQEVPPDYHTVIRLEDEELPSYLQAVSNGNEKFPEKD